MNSHLCDIERLVSPQDYQSSRSRIFPSESSLRWHLRAHRADLAAGGAVVRVAGRLLIDPLRFDEVVLTIAREKAASG